MTELYHCYIPILLFSTEHFGPNLRVLTPTQQVLGFFFRQNPVFSCFSVIFGLKTYFFVIFIYDRTISLLPSNPTFFLKSIFMKISHFLEEKMKHFKIFCNSTPRITPFSGENQPDFTKKSTLTGLNTTFFIINYFFHH